MQVLEVLKTALTGLIAAILTFVSGFGINIADAPVPTPALGIPAFEHSAPSAPETPEISPDETPEAPEKDTEPAEETPATVAPTVPAEAPSVETPTSVLVEEPEGGDFLTSFSDINTATRNSLVNIVCSAAAGSPLNGTSGSGVIISENGVVVTNAHVAQYYLLLNQPKAGVIDCVLRTGEPAKNTYRAELVYLPPQWIADNTDQLTKETPTGTGEFDFAFLRITERIDGDSIGDTAFVTPDVAAPATDEPVLLAGYAAGFLGNTLVSRNLSITSSVTTVQRLFTFGGGDVDLVDVSGTIVSQKGSSGGAVVDEKGNLRALIVTSSQDEDTSERQLRAVTLAHANRVLLASTNQTFSQFIAKAPVNGANFRINTQPSLSAQLVAAIGR